MARRAIPLRRIMRLRAVEMAMGGLVADPRTITCRHLLLGEDLVIERGVVEGAVAAGAGPVWDSPDGSVAAAQVKGVRDIGLIGVEMEQRPPACQSRLLHRSHQLLADAF